jgi:ankyrin repeat protein
MIDDRDKKGWTLLHHAVARGDLREVKGLLSVGDDVNAKTEYYRAIDGNKVCSNSTSLHIAAQFGFVDVAHCLLENGADIEAVDKLR